MDFTESAILEIPKIGRKVAELRESKDQGLIIEVAAIHAGMTANYNNYSADELKKACESWTTPYPKPLIINHDQYTKPIGRIQAARMAEEDDGAPYTALQIAVLDSEAVEMVADGRYVTGSVGGRAGKALCSVCNEDWANASVFSGPPCKHKRGETYKGKLAYFDMQELTFVEYSFVNTPADKRSLIKSKGASATESVITYTEEELENAVSTHFFSIGLKEQSVFELCEAENRDMLAELKTKEATPLYHNLRGAFLSTLANDLSEEQANMTDPQEDEDILAVSEDLSADLDTPADEPEEDETPEDDQEVEAGGGDGNTSDTDADDDAAPADGEPNVDAESDADDAEDDGDNDVDNEDEEPEPEEAEESDADEDPEDEDPEDEAEEESEEEDEEPAEADAEAGEESDQRITALEAEVDRLSEENARLRTALKRTLVERVVDTKIALGLVAKSDRASSIEEHEGRSANSLADSLRDMSAMTPVKPTEFEIPTTEGHTKSQGSKEKNVEEDEEDESTKVVESEDKRFVTVFSDRMLGRTKF